MTWVPRFGKMSCILWCTEGGASLNVAGLAGLQMIYGSQALIFSWTASCSLAALCP